MKTTGFSLIELLIVVTIIGILAAIALPSYQQYVYRANRTLAKGAMLKIATQQETFYNDRKAYATALTQFNVSSTVLNNYPADVVYLQRDGSLSGTSSSRAIYSITLTGYTSATAVGNCTVSGSATTLQYAIKATALNSQARDSACLNLCYGSAGDRGTSASGGANTSDCWRK